MIHEKHDHHKPKIIKNNVTGERIEFIETDEDALIFDDFIPAGLQGPPLHKHPRQEERFTVLRGTLKANVDGKWQTYEEGETLVVPKNTPHTFDNQGGGDVSFRVELRPALESEAFFRGVTKMGKVKPVQFERLRQKYDTGFEPSDRMVALMLRLVRLLVRFMPMPLLGEVFSTDEEKRKD